jgi:predicted anti-sigma-YlaC factor YlaD
VIEIRMLHHYRISVILSVGALLTGCSVRQIAMDSIGGALAESSGRVYASDDDPELVRDALPFSLKLMETVLAESPENRDLLLATSAGFTQYSYAFVEQDAAVLEDEDYLASEKEVQRARKLYLRARDYGMRGLESAHPGFEEGLRTDPETAVAAATIEDVDLLYWTAAAWGSAIGLSIDDPSTIGQMGLMEALIYRAYELAPDFDYGAIHGFLITYEMTKKVGDPAQEEKARAHFARAIALSDGQQAGPYLSLAEAVSIPKQDRVEFEHLLNQALAIDPDARPEWRLVNLIMQERAKWLLDRTDRLFLD